MTMSVTQGNNSGALPLNVIPKSNFSPTVESSSATSAGNTISTSQTWVIGESSYMYMRAKAIEFTAEGLKPNTEYYPFFDGVYVGRYCSSVDNAQSSPIRTDSLGNIVGMFYLPSNTFTVGSHKFELVDHVIVSDGLTTADPIFGSATAFYDANGTLKTLQTQVTNTVINVNNTNIINNVVNINTSNSNVIAVNNVPTTGSLTSQQSQDQTNLSPPVATNPGVTPETLEVNNDATPPTGPSFPGAVPQRNPPSIKPPPPPVCEEWRFVYRLDGTAAVTTSKIVTNSTAEPPQAAVFATRPGVAAGAASVQYTGFTQLPNGQYEHTFRRTETTGRIFFATWRGRKAALNNENTLKDPVSYTNAAAARARGFTARSVIYPWTKLREIPCSLANGQVTFSIVGDPPPPPPPRRDPLAQSFMIDEVRFPNGCFVTDIAIYFRTVDQSTPVTLELRDMVNAFPGPNILPHGIVIVPGQSTFQSNDASVATVFTFDQPIFLKPATEYCFVVKSPTLGYNVWCSRVGELDVGTNTFIDVTPYLGTLFKSENDRTWTPDSYEDMKFDLFTAEFDVSKTGDLMFLPQKDEVTNNYYGTGHTLPLSYMSTEVNSKEVSIQVPLHGLDQGDKVFITGIAQPNPISAYNNILHSDLMGEFNVVRVIDSDNFVILTTGNSANKTGRLAVQDTQAFINTDPPPVTNRMTFETAPVVSNDNTFSPSSAPIKVDMPARPLAPAITSSTTFTIYTNVMVHEAMIDYLGTEVEQTEIEELINIAGGRSIAPENPEEETPYERMEPIEVQRDGRFYEFSEPRMVASPRNEFLHKETLEEKPSLEANLKLRSTNKDLSPVVDLQAMSVIVETYKIDNQNNEIEALVDPLRFDKATLDDFNNPLFNSEVVPGRGTAAAKYKSTLVNLNEFYYQLHIFVVGTCPDPAVIDCYARTSTDEFTHRDRNWEWVPVDGVFGTPFNQSEDKDEMREWMFIYKTPAAFNAFDIKLVMRSRNTSIVPKIYAVRAIADKAQI